MIFNIDELYYIDRQQNKKRFCHKERKYIIDYKQKTLEDYLK